MNGNSYKTVEMKLAAEPFAQFISGEKTVEVRLNDQKRREIKVGDVITFTNRVDGRVINRRVAALHRFVGFKELATSAVADKCGFKDLSPIGVEKVMRAYYTEEDEREYGVLAIETEALI